MRWLMIGISVFVLFLVGCGPEFERLEFEQLSTPPIATSLMSNHIELTAGTGIMVRVKPISSNSEQYRRRDEVVLDSRDLEFLRVYKGEKNREFGIAACKPGSSYVRVYINGSHEKDIEVTIN